MSAVDADLMVVTDRVRRAVVELRGAADVMEQHDREAAVDLRDRAHALEVLFIPEVV